MSFDTAYWKHYDWRVIRYYNKDIIEDFNNFYTVWIGLDNIQTCKANSYHNNRGS